MKRTLLILVIGLSLVSCAQSSDIEHDTINKNLDSLQTAYFASGCFWCSEAIFETIDGIHEVESGYAGGTQINPTYKQVCSGTTGHSETVKIYYDSSVVRFDELIEVFFNSHDPTTLNQQGPDSGTQYRSIAFYQNDEEKILIENKISSLLSDHVFPIITTEVIPLDEFFIAEQEHQNYVKNNLNRSYVQNVSKPRMSRFLSKMPKFRKANPFN